MLWQWIPPHPSPSNPAPVAGKAMGLTTSTARKAAGVP